MANEEIGRNTAGQSKRQLPWLKKYQWKPGQSGNPKGGKVGKTLKGWAKEFLMELPDDKKLEFLKEIAPEIVWKMAEGNPAQDLLHGNNPEFPFQVVDINKIPKKIKENGAGDNKKEG